MKVAREYLNSHCLSSPKLKLINKLNQVLSPEDAPIFLSSLELNFINKLDKELLSQASPIFIFLNKATHGFPHIDFGVLATHTGNNTYQAEV